MSRAWLRTATISFWLASGAILVGTAAPSHSEPLTPHQQLAFDIYKELVRHRH